MLLLSFYSSFVNIAVGATEDFTTLGGNIRFQVSGVSFLGATQGVTEETYDFSAPQYSKIQIDVEALTNSTLEYPDSENDLQLYSDYYAHFFYEDKGVQRDLKVSASFDAVPHGTGIANSYDVWIEYAYSKSFSGSQGYSGTIHLAIKVDDESTTTITPNPTAYPSPTSSDTGSFTPTNTPNASPSTPDIFGEYLDFNDLGLLGLLVAIVIVVFIIIFVALLAKRKPEPANPNAIPTAAIVTCPVCRRTLAIYRDNYGPYGYCTYCNKSYRL